ncbi:MAG: ABC transporter ATP-binding protein/permease [Clostridia bacterium]|nr:ABC transporter ATP-binding protein/permease [Clostridia bacterium]
MLEIRDLVKVYRPKKGVPVTAIDHISLRLPEQGMVFLLGKSGSGKSTLLNLLGGLDTYDSGDILIRNESSKQFRQQHFDSYRNAYVGFIFQEYNVLEEFTVGANIALAIELQGKKATDEQINAILQEVDLAGYGGRRPNELSGGQKQRVAIARALVKQPKIIMADEPTGALDSGTGRQIFDTLKKLSADRLVLVVSHDREFAEQYADRIIELADGKVIADQTYVATDTAAQPVTYEGSTITVTAGYHLTEEDRLAINAYLDGLEADGTITVRRRTDKKAIPTDNSQISQPAGGLQLLRSKLPLRSAFKIGASSLKHKRFRLVVTILLSCIAFGLFGLADTFGAYNHIQACTDSLIDSGVDYASVAEQRREYDYDDNPYYTGGYYISDGEVNLIRQETGIAMKGVYVPKGWTMDFYHQLSPKFEDSDTRALYTTDFSGFSDITAAELLELDYKLVAGTLPHGDKDEIAISAYIADMFVDCDFMQTDGLSEGTPVAIDRREQLVGKVLYLNNVPFTITGIIDTRFDLARYTPLTEDVENMTAAEEIIRYALQKELDYAQRNSLHAVAFTGEGYVKRQVEAAFPVQSLNATFLRFDDEQWNIILDPYYIGTLADIRDTQVIWLDGKQRTTLGEKELVISLDMTEAALSVVGEGLPESPTQEELTALLQQTFTTIGPLREESERRWTDISQQDNAELYSGYTVVGYLDSASLEKGLTTTLITSPTLKEAIVPADEGYYSFAVGPMPTDREAVKQLVSFSYREEAVRYQLRNAVTYELDMIHEALVILSKVFLWIGVGFALFAALMLANFITVSISYKRQEIGILRAIGSRSNDVFRIFFSESFIIAMINFLLSSLGVGVVTAVINHVIRHEAGILLTVLHFGPRQIFLLLAVSLLVAAVASFFPVRRIAAKRPIDAIRGR